jgi:hypothetical protein
VVSRPYGKIALAIMGEGQKEDESESTRINFSSIMQHDPAQ